MPATPDLDALRIAVDASLASGDTAAALRAMYPVVHVLALEDGARLRDFITGLPEDLWHGDPVLTAALGSSYRSPGSPAGGAALAYFRAAESAMQKAVQPAPPISLASVMTGHAAALRSEGRLADAKAKLTDAGLLLEESVDSPTFIQHSARHSLELGVVELLMGALGAARRRLEYADGLSAHLARSEQLECMGALALAAYSQGDLATSDRMVAAVRAADAPSSVLNSGFAFAFHASEVLLATDRSAVSELPAISEAMVSASAHTEWEPLAAVVSAYTCALEGSPIAALDLLQRAHQIYLRWQPPGIGLDIGDLLRADILSGLDRSDEAFEILAALNPHESHALCPERFMARIALQHGDLHGADIALADCELLGEAHSPRTLIDVQLLRGAIELERGDLALSDVSTDRALHAMARTGVRSPFRHIPAALLARMTGRALERPQTGEIERMLLEVAEATDGHADGREALSERERLVLVYVERRLTVAQIAAELFISPNTVKTHLRRLYRKLGVATREEAIRKARGLGLHLGTANEITRESPARRGAGQDGPVI
ncbi:MAG TPA: LuxR C-terminal-related transcriptional regulator [Pseudolysinimonas sp.]|nr:LuxR C-terminal-related transcriptional regulator [Pseudolysinimonas sp.]